MNDDSRNIELSHGSIKELNNIILKNKKTIKETDYVFQIYKCSKHFNIDYYSCSLFDSDSISNNFILRAYKSEKNGNRKSPLIGDIINVKQVTIIILNDDEHLLYICKKIKVLKRKEIFVLNPSNLIQNSTKRKIGRNSIKLINNNNIFSNGIYNDYNIKNNKILIILLLLIINEQNNNKIQEHLVLLNKNIIEQYQNECYEIFKLLNINKEKIKNYISKICDPNVGINQQYIKNILSIINNLSSNRTNIINETQNIETLLNPNYENVYLINKNIKVYKEFILVNGHIFNYIKNLFNIQINKQNINIYSIQNKDIITIEEEPQNTILIGNIVNANNIYKNYNIQYIFEYQTNPLYSQEKNILLFNGIDNYIKNKIVINENNNNDLLSPIISENKFIGYFYKYFPNVNYNYCFNYYNILTNDRMKILIFLYFNYKTLHRKIEEKNNEPIIEKYYIVNKKCIEEIKKYYNYDIITNIIKNNNIEQQDSNCLKKLLFVIKNLSNNVLIKFQENNILGNYKNYFVPNFKNIKFFDKQEKIIMIYDNFEIIQKGIFDDYIDNKTYYFLECIIIKGKIILNYPDNLNNNCQSVIGFLNCENTFITEYILIYKNKEIQKNHIKYICQNLIDFLKGLSFYEKSQPIIDKNYNEVGIIIQTAMSKIKDLFSCSAKIGLKNIGATCYMNATLQCFSHIEKFVNFFKYNNQAKNISNTKKDTLTYSFKLLIDNLWPDNFEKKNVKYYSPEEFKNKISNMNPLFEGIQANDAKDLVNFIILTLHIELNKINKKPNKNNSIILDQRDQRQMFNFFSINFIENNQSIISDLFYGINCNVTKCSMCNNSLYNYQTYFFIVFPLEEVRKFKNNNQFSFYNSMFNINMSNNVVNIYDCFDYDRRPNIMNGQNSIYCNFCKANCSAMMATYLTTGPEILILLLNRGKGIQFNVKIDFGEYLNLYNYIEMKNTGFNYKLIGVITHYGESSMSGHFIAYCRDPITSLWHKYNDSIVSDVNNFQYEVINVGMPYLLFYQKIN